VTATFANLPQTHSLQQEMIDKGFYTEERAKQELGSDMVTRALGAESAVKITFSTASTYPSGLFLLCSDGLSNMVDDTHPARYFKGPEPS